MHARVRPLERRGQWLGGDGPHLADSGRRRPGIAAAHAIACPVCGGVEVRQFLAVRGVPIFCNVLWPTHAHALAAEKGDIELALCGDCGHVFNAAFDPAKVEYSEAYENSLHFSQHFNSYAAHLSTHLVEAYGIRGKDIIDVGCGAGDFLALICETGNNRGYGFDKSYPGSRPASEQLTFIRDFYGERYAGYPCDLLCCRHVLEHIDRPYDFVVSIRNTLGGRKDVVVYFEVPNAAYTLRDLGIWDLIYEHCSYFSVSSLHQLFQLGGFAIQRISETYGGQYLGIECVPAAGDAPVPAASNAAAREICASVDRFPHRYRDKLDHWRGVCTELKRSGKRAVIWGGGSKGVTFLNLLKPFNIVGVIDLNPRKHGRYIPGTGHELMSPDRLPDLMPDVVIIMNEVYRDEIRKYLDAKRLSPELLTV